MPTFSIRVDDNDFLNFHDLHKTPNRYNKTIEKKLHTQTMSAVMLDLMSIPGNRTVALSCNSFPPTTRQFVAMAVARVGKDPVRRGRIRIAFNKGQEVLHWSPSLLPSDVKVTMRKRAMSAAAATSSNTIIGINHGGVMPSAGGHGCMPMPLETSVDTTRLSRALPVDGDSPQPDRNFGSDSGAADIRSAMDHHGVGRRVLCFPGG